MANINLNFDALTALKDWWEVVKANFAAINDQLIGHISDADTRMTNHISGISEKHSGNDIKYNEQISINSAIDTVDNRIDNLINNPDPSKDLEIVDGRLSSKYGSFTTLKDRLDNSDTILSQSLFIQQEEPTNISSETLWLKITDLAETAIVEPNTEYLFETIE
jgi:hypothetical protein